MALKPDMVGVVVKDLPRAIAFYQLLGLPFADVAADAGYAEVTTANGYRISLNAESVAAGIHGSFHAPPAHASQRMELAFRCDAPAEVDSTVARLRAAGHAVVKDPWDAFWGQRYAIVADPDGTHLSLFAPL
jgi:catechol 2,3-dioxygenase-like lactoylglutathione lyase family enzyme